MSTNRSRYYLGRSTGWNLLYHGHRPGSLVYVRRTGPDEFHVLSVGSAVRLQSYLSKDSTARLVRLVSDEWGPIPAGSDVAGELGEEHLARHPRRASLADQEAREEAELAAAEAWAENAAVRQSEMSSRDYWLEEEAAGLA
jgi:hypothetical protein